MPAFAQSLTAHVREGTRAQQVSPQSPGIIPLIPDCVGKHISKAGCWRPSRCSISELDKPNSQVLSTTQKTSSGVSGNFAPFCIFSLRGSFCYKMVPFLRLSTAPSLVRNVLERMLIIMLVTTTSQLTSIFITVRANVYRVLVTKLQELCNMSCNSSKPLRQGLYLRVIDEETEAQREDVTCSWSHGE